MKSEKDSEEETSEIPHQVRDDSGEKLIRKRA